MKRFYIHIEHLDRHADGYHCDESGTIFFSNDYTVVQKELEEIVNNKKPLRSQAGIVKGVVLLNIRDAYLYKSE